MSEKNTNPPPVRARRDRYGRPELVMGDHVLSAGAAPRPATTPGPLPTAGSRHTR